MAARLTDRQKKKIVADYINTQSVNAAADLNGVSWNTANRVIKGSGDIAEKLEQKKEENTAEALEYLESRAKKMKEAIDLHLEALTDKEKIEAATLSQISTSFGTLTDKLLLVKDKRGGGSGDKVQVIIDVGPPK